MFRILPDTFKLAPVPSRLRYALLTLLLLVGQMAFAWHYHAQLDTTEHCTICLHAEANHALIGIAWALPVTPQTPPRYRQTGYCSPLLVPFATRQPRGPPCA